jgi:hypothetical protein
VDVGYFNPEYELFSTKRPSPFFIPLPDCFAMHVLIPCSVFNKYDLIEIPETSVYVKAINTFNIFV